MTIATVTATAISATATPPMTPQRRLGEAVCAEAQSIRKLLTEEWQLAADDGDAGGGSDAGVSDPGVSDPAGAADSVPTQQTPSRQGDNGADSVTIPTGSAGPTKDQ